VIDEEIRKAILRNTDSATLNEIAVKNGMIPLIEDGLNKAKLGLTTREEVLMAAKVE